jgi:hypothetical protein
MSRASVLARGRAFAEGGFVDTCEIVRPGEPQTDLTDGRVTTPTTAVYQGRCRVKQAAAPWAGPATVGEAQLRLAALELQLPIEGSEGIRVDDQVTITACVHDVELVGRVFTVVGEHAASHITTRRLPLQQVLS